MVSLTLSPELMLSGFYVAALNYNKSFISGTSGILNAIHMLKDPITSRLPVQLIQRYRYYLSAQEA